ncbi:MAG: phosphotransferase [Candidatus Azobacteroides sp.]|nr:phosphotransferase [Candidatus Azobacteroides sp.]
MAIEKLNNLFLLHTGEIVQKTEKITGSGSNRQYFRMYGKKNTCIGVKGESPEENNAFITLAKHFKKKGLPVPEVYIVSDDMQYYLQEDVGNVSLFDLIEKRDKKLSFAFPEKELLFKTIRLLPYLQFKGAQELDFSVCYPVENFDAKSISWDLNYFKYCFLKLSGIDFSEPKLENDFERLTKILLQSDTNTFMYRDFQSRNIMIKDHNVSFIDFQGGRRGPIYYDLASFVWQAKADFSEEERNKLIDFYLDELKKITSVDISSFYTILPHFVLFRTLQVLGAYSFRGYFEKKEHFLQSIPFAVKNISSLLKGGFPEYPYLSEILYKFISTEQKICFPENLPLVVTVYSFSYKKGIPQDPSDNGGGFIFDCRAIHNPGRYEEYKQLTGLDEPVKQFLSQEKEMTDFLQNAVSLIEASVRKYIERDFTHLMVSFGCTGGQHRSVYSAQKLAEYIHQKFNVEVRLIHREQQIEKTFSRMKKI